MQTEVYELLVNIVIMFLICEFNNIQCIQYRKLGILCFRASCQTPLDVHTLRMHMFSFTCTDQVQ